MVSCLVYPNIGQKLFTKRCGLYFKACPQSNVGKNSHRHCVTRSPNKFKPNDCLFACPCIGMWEIWSQIKYGDLTCDNLTEKCYFRLMNISSPFCKETQRVDDNNNMISNNKIVQLPYLLVIFSRGTTKNILKNEENICICLRLESINCEKFFTNRSVVWLCLCHQSELVTSRLAVYLQSVRLGAEISTLCHQLALPKFCKELKGNVNVTASEAGMISGRHGY